MKGKKELEDSNNQDKKQEAYRTRRDSFSDDETDLQSPTRKIVASYSSKSDISNRTESTKSMSDLDSEEEPVKKEPYNPSKTVTDALKNGSDRMKEHLELQFAIEASFESEKNVRNKRKIDDLGEQLNGLNVSFPTAKVDELGDVLGQFSMNSKQSATISEEPSRKRQKRSDSTGDAVKKDATIEKSDNSEKSFVSRLGRSKSEPDFRKIIEEQKNQNSSTERRFSF